MEQSSVNHVDLPLGLVMCRIVSCANKRRYCKCYWSNYFHRSFNTALRLKEVNSLRLAAFAF